MADLLRTTYMNTTVVQQYVGRGDLADSARLFKYWSWTLTLHMFSSWVVVCTYLTCVDLSLSAGPTGSCHFRYHRGMHLSILFTFFLLLCIWILRGGGEGSGTMLAMSFHHTYSGWVLFVKLRSYHFSPCLLLGHSLYTGASAWALYMVTSRK